MLRIVRIELHCHSTCSDGSFPPNEVAAAAGEYGVELFALTDHDTYRGYDTTREVLDDRVKVLRSLELSCKYEGRTVHLLMYGLRPGVGLDELAARLDTVLETRTERIHAICDLLRTFGIDLDAREVLATAHGSPGRPHVAQALLEHGHVSSVREAFDRFLGDGQKAFVNVDRIQLDEGLAFGRAAGARMALAHPHTLKHVPVVREMFQRHRHEGLEGIEAFYGPYGDFERRPWLGLAAELDLVVTGGSDFHGAATPAISGPGIDLPEPHAGRVLDWLLGERPGDGA